MYKILISNTASEIKKTNNPMLGANDVLIEVVSSFYSMGTESANISKIQMSALQKAIRYRDQVKALLRAGDFKGLYRKINKQLDAESESGYASFGRVVDYGVNVSTVQKGQFVIAAGPKAIHASHNVVPAGLVFPSKADNRLAAAPVVAIALNSIIKAQLCPGDRILVIGAGLLGQFILQIANKMAVIVDVVDMSDERKTLAESNGANTFFSAENFVSSNAEYDAVVSTAPVLSKDDWAKYLSKTRVCGTVVLVGAADLEIPRDIFYHKRLKFISAYSYGAGRTEYEFENGLNGKPVLYNSGPSVDELIARSSRLILGESLSFSSIETVELNDATSLSSIFEKKALGYLFTWERVSDHYATPTLNPPIPDFTIDELTEIDIYGYSSFVKDSHLPALSQLGVSVKNIFTHSPSSKEKLHESNANKILISTPHGEHLRCINNSIEYPFVFVDKPIVCRISELSEYYQLADENMIIGLMSRRYSGYVDRLLEFLALTSRKEDIYLQLVFNVEEKSATDRIYYEGGRLIGEMVHHLDLAVYILGEVAEIHVTNFDDAVSKQSNENFQAVIKHVSGATSRIEYAAKSNPLFRKEYISISTASSSLAIFDFSRMLTENYDCSSVTESDKGVKNMWSIFQKKFDAADEEFFYALRAHDLYVYKLLEKILG